MATNIKSLGKFTYNFSGQENKSKQAIMNLHHTIANQHFRHNKTILPLILPI